MRRLYLILWISHLCMFVKGAADDPCKTAPMFPNSLGRLVHAKVDPAAVNNDRYLPTGWYRPVDDMPTDSTDIAPMSCGTYLPIWLNGALPTTDNEVVTRQACIFNWTSNCGGGTIDVKIKHCPGDYNVYYLKNTNSDSQAYCFGIGEDAAVPSFEADIITVETATIYMYQGESLQLPKMYAKCMFNESDKEKDLFYYVSWYMDDVEMFSMPSVLYTDINQTDLELTPYTVGQLNKGFACSVRPRTTRNSPPGKTTKSQIEFLGLEVKKRTISFYRGQYGIINLRLTTPLRCVKIDGFEVPCALSVALYQDGLTGNCEGISTDVANEKTIEKCGIRLASETYSEWKQIKVHARQEDDIVFEHKMTIILKTNKFEFLPVWSTITLPAIYVNILEPDINPLSKKCYAVNDPHMKSFDDRHYELQFEGDFILYRHNTKDSPVEVQVKFRSCSLNGHAPVCVCGVAVRAGRDVYVIDVCVPQAKKTCFEYSADELLDVRRAGDMFEIYTHLGTRIQVRYRQPRFLTVFINPTFDDVEKTEGLCGTLNNKCEDDFTKSNGDLLPDLNCNFYNRHRHPIDFTKSWTLVNSNSDSLFDGLKDSLAPDIKTHYCMCTDTENVNSTKLPYPNINCSKSVVATCQRNQRPAKQVNNRQCNILSRRKRALTSHEFYLLQREKRSDNQDYMDETDAKNYCEQFFNNSESVKRCGTILDVSPSIDICMLDISLTNTTSYSEATRQGFQDGCLVKLDRNSSYESTSHGGLSIPSLIRAVACPNECSGHGSCQNGTCVCDTNYGYNDCSKDIREPPLINGHYNGDGCSIRESDCTEAVLSVDNMIDNGNQMCKLIPFEMASDGAMIQRSSIFVPTIMETPFIAACEYPKIVKRSTSNGTGDVFVTGYIVSVSNDGVTYSDELQFFIFDPLCQEQSMVNGSAVFELKSGYCFIDNVCVSIGTISSSDSCKQCQDTTSKFEWSVTKGCETTSASIGTTTSIPQTTTSTFQKTTTTTTQTTTSTTPQETTTSTPQLTTSTTTLRTTTTSTPQTTTRTTTLGTTMSTSPMTTSTDSIRSTTSSPQNSESTTTATKESTGSPRQMEIVIIAIVCAILAILVVLGVGVYCFKLKHKKKVYKFFQ